MVRHSGVPTGRTFPDTYPLGVGRLQRSHLPLIDRVIRDAVQADVAVRPGLGTGPLDAFIKVARFPGRKMIDISRRSSGPARVDPHPAITITSPLYPFHPSPILPLVSPASRTF